MNDERALGERDDLEIAQDVHRGLDSAIILPDRSVRASVSRGVVTLDGTVRYFSQCYDAERSVERLPGVKGVVNRIEVRPPAHADVDQARLAVHEALDRHAADVACGIDLRDVHGAVNVSGTVDSRQEKDAILDALRAVPGVRNVIDNLVVED